jgi:quercetin dioxygenase-like cupin family protein
MQRTNRICFALAIALWWSLAIMGAQQPSVKRTELQRGDLSVPGREAVMAKAEIPAGGATGRHTHPGEEVSYVAQGTLMLDVEGQPSRMLKAGDVFLIRAGAIHNAMNHESGTATVIATYIVEKGKALATPVP